jgi:putative hydrolase of the HAD superfamily
MSPSPAQLPLPTPRAVLFDVDFTLLRPSDQFEAAGYHARGLQFGLDLDVARWHDAERAAYAAIQESRRLHGDAHDEGMLYSIARAIVVALGGGGESAVEACTRAVMEAWVNYENFGLYDDVVPCLEQLRRAGLRIALVSNTERDLEHFLTHFALEPLVDAVIASAVIGVLKPALAIFTAAFEALAVHPGEAVMVGDNLDDDVRGGQRSGCGAILLDRDGRHELDVPTIRSLAELPAALGLEPSPAGAKPVSSGTDAGGTSPRRGQ